MLHPFLEFNELHLKCFEFALELFALKGGNSAGFF